MSVVDSRIAENFGEFGIGILLTRDAELRVAGSTIADNFGLLSYGVFGVGTVTIADSRISGQNGVDGASGITLGGYRAGSGPEVTSSLVIERSAVYGNGTQDYSALPGGIYVNGPLTMLNSSVVGNGTSPLGRNQFGIEMGPAGAALIVNSTIADNGGAGLLSRLGDAPFSLFNSIVVGSGDADAPVRLVATGGANLIGDRDGVTTAQLFVPGGLADNGGPTPTLALLPGADNPAIDAGITADARRPDGSPLETDQRGPGFARLVGGAVDLGAFELGAGPLPPDLPAPPLPPLAEKTPLADADILGAPRGFLTLTGGDAGITFVDEYAAFQNSLGVYLVGPDGTIGATAWAFERIEHSEPSDLASELARPGGGPLSPGDTVLLSDLFAPDDLAPGVEFGLFLVADGWSRNPETVFAGGTLDFRTDGAPARVTDTTPDLVHIAADGSERLVRGDIMHTIDAGSPNPLSNTLNPGGTGQVTSGVLDGRFVIAFEDKPLDRSDRDFNDVLVAIDLLDPGDAAPAAAIPAAAALDTLLAPAETV